MILQQWTRDLAALLSAAAILTASSPAWSQPTTQSADAVIVAPRLLTDSAATYPTQALNDGVATTMTVTLILDVDATGAVRKATVDAPQGHGFDEAATAAAAKLVFEPATRGGVPVAARIKYQYVFQPPAPRLVGRVTAQESDRPIPDAVVVVRTADGSERTSAVAADGTWGVDGLPPGAVHITISATGYTQQEVDDEIAAGEETSVVLRLSHASSPKAATSGQGGTDEEPEEVNVRGQRPPREVTKRSLTKDEIAHIPGTNGDALRSIQSLPGVARPPPFAGALVVRGSAPHDTTVFVDGVDVPLVYHFGGLSSVVPTELLEKIDFYPSNYSAVYGRGMGGMVDVRLRDPKNKLSGMAQVDLLDARLLVEGPVFSTGWKFLVAGRRSWFDAWLGPVLEATDASVSTTPRYYDYQAMVEKDIDRHSSFRLTFFGSDDKLEILNQAPSASAPTFAGNFGAHTTFWRAHARYENKFTDSTALKIIGAVGHDSIDTSVGTIFLKSSQTPVTGRLELTQKIVRGVQANVGADVIYAPYELALRAPPPRRPGVPSGGPLDVPQESRQSGSRTMPAFYTEWELVPSAGTRIVPGLRADYSNTTKGWDLSPRVNVRQDLTRGFPRSTVKGGAGLFYQPPTAFETDPVFGQPNLKTNRSVHYDVGFEQELTSNVELSTDLFYKALDRLVVTSEGNSGEGRAYGAELLLKYKADSRFFGWLAYTISRSERRDTPNEPLRLFQYDQTHILTALGSYTLGRGWRLGGRFRLVSGNLYTPETQGAFDATTGADLSAPMFPPYGSRLPAFHQLDVRVDKTWMFPKWSLTFYVDVQNVYVHRSPEDVAYNYNYTQSERLGGLPILPSVGLRGEL